MAENMDFDAREQELLAQLQKIRDERTRIETERKKKEEETAPVIITANSVSGLMLNANMSRVRPDVIEVIESYPNAIVNRWRASFIVPIANWDSLVETVVKRDNVTISQSAEIVKQIDYLLNTPAWQIELSPDKRKLLAKYGPGSRYHILGEIPGAENQWEKKYYTIPLSEGWRIFDKMQQENGVVWNEDAQAIVIGQIEARTKLDKIAKMERGEKYLDYDFNGIATGYKLRPFQEVGVEFVEATGGRALIADEMGLGKTSQALAYAVKNNLRAVIICPASLKPNWAREIKNLSGKRPTVLFGSEPSTETMISMIRNPAQFTLVNYDVIANRTTNIKVTKDKEGFTHEERQERFLWVELINLSKPDLIIIDEGHYFKNVDALRSQACRLLKAVRIVILTGTPVLNRPGELWPMLYLLAPDQFPSHELFLKQYTYDGKSARNVQELHALMKSIMIRRLKKDVVKELPPIVRIPKYHDLSAKALKLYRKIESGVYETIAEFSPTGQGGDTRAITHILAQIQRLKMVCAIDKVEETADLATELYESGSEDEDRKVLIFTQYKAVAYAIAQRLEIDRECLSFVRRTASGFLTVDNNERDALVQRFQTDPKIKYLVVTEKTAKEGHNITAGGHVIFNDLFWTPAGHSQGEGRAYGRLSNLHSISSYYSITDMDGESIEEWIWAMLQSKMATIEEVVEGVEGSRGDESIAMELINKMRENMFIRKGRNKSK